MTGGSTAAGRTERAEALLGEVEAYMLRFDPPQGGQARMGDYAALQAIRGNDAELNRAFESLAPERKAGAPPSQYSLNLLMTMLNLYYNYRDRLGPPAVCHFWRVLLQACAPQSRIHRYDFGFSNTNHPLKCAAIQVLAGEILSDEEIVASGLEKLRGFSRKLAVGVGTPYSEGGYIGAVSEFNSPTYAALQLMPAALLANHSGLPEARALGTLFQELIFMDVLSHWHPPTQESAGPTSRGYMDNTLGGTGLLKYVLHMVLPGGVFYDTSIGWWTDHHGDISSAVQAVAIDFQAPDYLIELALQRRYPHVVQMKTDTFGYIFPNGTFHPGTVDTYAYQTENFTLGSSSRSPGTGGQSDSPLLRWRVGSPVTSMDDHKVAFFRYRDDTAYTFRQSSLQDVGVKNTLQHENVALALYRPRPFPKPVETLRLDVCIPIRAGLEAVYLGDERLAFRGASVTAPAPASASASEHTHHPARVLIKDGPVVIGLCPLALTDLGRGAAMRVSEREGIAIFSFINYEGPKRTFTVEELLRVRSGVAVVVDEVAEGESTEAAIARLRARLQSATITDEISDDLVRTVTFDDGRVALAGTLSHHDVHFADRMANGIPYTPRVFSGPRIQTVAQGEVALAGAVLRNEDPTPLRLLASADAQTFVIYNFYPEAAAYQLQTPSGETIRGKLGRGRMIYRRNGATWSCEHLDAASPRILGKPQDAPRNGFVAHDRDAHKVS